MCIMSKKYTAQEMRSRADEFKEYLDNPNHFAVKEIDDDSRVLMEMLYQAADLQESEEREKKWEYGVFASYGVDEYDSLEHARRVAGKKARVVRRYVGEWEEV